MIVSLTHPHFNHVRKLSDERGSAGGCVVRTNGLKSQVTLSGFDPPAVDHPEPVSFRFVGRDMCDILVGGV
ncbi:hypothetical protein RRG08_052899 [Elysia crispata]|uniref:Uncharacterized protein n=1 Tax=Elysia crispata TaxID=231223 RepID=A0AAE0ZFE2_9GAST|nr:hypothetical protein RRG08_052899 [Elysia crispata]